MGFIKDYFDDEHGPLKVIMLFLLPIAAVLFFLSVVYLFVVYGKIDPEQWNLFFNIRLPLIAIQVPTVILTVFLVDWCMPGNTIRVITQIDAESSLGEKAVAAAFLFGIGLLALGAVVFTGGV